MEGQNRSGRIVKAASKRQCKRNTFPCNTGVARMKLYEHMQNEHQDCVKFCNSEQPGEVEGAVTTLLSYNTQSAICFFTIGTS